MSRYTVLSNLLGGEMLSSFFESAVYFFMQEIWKKVPIEPFSEYYEVSNLGRVRSLDREVLCRSGTVHIAKGKTLSQALDGHGYPFVLMQVKENKIERHVHRLVALAFVENPKPDEYNVVNHKDENPLNNKEDNLEWCTHHYNVLYGTAQERRAKSKCRPFIACDETGKIVAAYQKLDDAKADGFNKTIVHFALHGKYRNNGERNTEHLYKGLSWWFV